MTKISRMMTLTKWLERSTEETSQEAEEEVSEVEAVTRDSMKAMKRIRKCMIKSNILPGDSRSKEERETGTSRRRSMKVEKRRTSVSKEEVRNKLRRKNKNQ
jgi:hypothetical protein